MLSFFLCLWCCLHLTLLLKIRIFFFRSVLSCLILSMKSNKICNFFCWLNRDGQNTYLYIVLLLCMCGDILDHLRILQTIMQRDVSGMEEKSLNLSCLGKSGTKLTTNGQTKQRFFKIKWKETKNEIKTNSQKVFRVKYFIRTFGIDERRWTIFNSQICNRSMTMANKFFFSFDTFTRIWELRLNYRTVQHLITWRMCTQQYFMDAIAYNGLVLIQHQILRISLELQTKLSRWLSNLPRCTLLKDS